MYKVAIAETKTIFHPSCFARNLHPLTTCFHKLHSTINYKYYTAKVGPYQL